MDRNAKGLLIMKYLDNMLSGDERAALDSLLKTDREAAELFCDLTMQQVQLFRVAKSQPVRVRRRGRKAWLRFTVAAAAAMILLAAGLWWAQPTHETRPGLTISGSYHIQGGGLLARNAIIVTKDGPAEIGLGGYCRVAMQPDTTLMIKGTDGAEEVFLEEGAITCAVVKEQGTFAVATERGNARVHGTAFTVQTIVSRRADGSRREKMVVAVSEGTVELSGDGDPLMLSAGLTAAVPWHDYDPLNLADFEDGTGGIFVMKDVQVTDRPGPGSKAARMDANACLNMWSYVGLNWGAYDRLQFEVDNPGQEPVRLPITIKDVYYNRHYYWWISHTVTAQPGRSTITLNLHDLTRGDGGRHDPQDAPPFAWDAVVQIMIGGPDRSGQVCWLDNIKLVPWDTDSFKITATAVLADFEQQPAGPLTLRDGAAVRFCEGLDSVAAHLPRGSSFIYEKYHDDWSDYDLIRFDAFNPGDAPRTIHVVIRDSEPPGYYSRINRACTVPPGRTTVTLHIPWLRRGDQTVQDWRDARPFFWNDIYHFYGTADNEVYVDNIRLEKIATAPSP